VRPQRLEQRLDAAATDEGHDEVDAVGRRDLREHLAPDTRLARCVGQERRVEQRDERRARRYHGTLGEERGGLGRAGGELDQPSRELGPHRHALVVSEGLERTLDDATDMEGDAVRSLRGMERTFLDEQRRRPRELGLERLGDQSLVESSP
jgi:hypothetical protein